jgi:hypothetical protein
MRSGMIYGINDAMRESWEQGAATAEFVVRVNERTRRQEIDPYHIDAQYHYDPDAEGEIAYDHLPITKSLNMRWGNVQVITDDSIPDGEYVLGRIA